MTPSSAWSHRLLSTLWSIHWTHPCFCWPLSWKALNLWTSTTRPTGPPSDRTSADIAALSWASTWASPETRPWGPRSTDRRNPTTPASSPSSIYSQSCVGLHPLLDVPPSSALGRWAHLSRPTAGSYPVRNGPERFARRDLSIYKGGWVVTFILKDGEIYLGCNTW